MRNVRRSTLQACSFRSIAIALSVSLAANAPLAALADSRQAAPPLNAAADPVSSRKIYRIVGDSTPAPSQHAPAASAAAADKTSQENVFWDSAQRSNTAADYKAYLDAFPNGFYAQLAKNRIAAMGAQPAPAAAAANEPAPPSAAALKAEVGTMETEQTLNLTPADRTELQQRLQALGLYSGPINGDLGAAFRAAVGTWQKQHELAPTGWLGPVELAALKAESDAAGPPPGAQPGPAPAHPAAAAANSDKAAQEGAFWESAQRSNLAGDYQAYLNAYPNGLYAPMARNRIANLENAPPPGAAAPGPGPGVPSAFGPPPQPVSPEALKAEVGTVETEQALDIGPPGRIELQQRLTALGLYNGPIDGDIGPMARSAIAEWQKRHDLAPTGDLGPLELSALRIESEPAYDQFIASRRVVVAPVYAPVRRYYHTEAAAPVRENNGAPAVLGAILGGVALGILGAKLGGGRFGGGKGGGKGGGGKGGGKRKK